MKMFKPSWAVLAVAVVAGTLAGCSTAPARAVDITANLRASLDQGGFKDVAVMQDRDKGVVTLVGHVPSDGDKVEAGRVATSLAGNQVVSNQIAVVPPGDASDAKKVNSALDDGIESNLHAALITDKLDDGVKFTVKNHVVTLTGQVNSQAKRAQTEQVAAAVLNVQQVVNELQVKNQKATTTQ